MNSFILFSEDAILLLGLNIYCSKISLMLFTNIINHSMSEGTYLSYSRSKNISEEQSFQSSLSL